MKKILVLGAGRSSGALIRYLLDLAPSMGWTIAVGDVNVDAAKQKAGSDSFSQAIYFNIDDNEASVQSIHWSDVVISLLPPPFHPRIAALCLRFGKHLLTASYVSEDMRQLHEQALQRGLLFLNECGLDPGIDHMSAMMILDKIKSRGGIIRSFESFTGGLPETDPDNPWRYKFTWNPKNVVTAGQSTARYKEDGVFKYIPYQQLFRRITQVSVEGSGRYEGYANRDSLKYLGTYGLDHVETMIRGTLRNEGFCEAWDVLVQLGCCDDSYQMENTAELTHAEFLGAFLPRGKNDMVERLKGSTGAGTKVLEKLQWSGFFSNEKVGLIDATPAEVTEHILQKRWAMKTTDRDMIVMWHRFGYTLEGKYHVATASLVVKGDDAEQTAMAKTVGLPLGFAARLLIEGKIRSRGVAIPVLPEFYRPILSDLEAVGISMTEIES
jgi:saccharopine dehydrogenase (NADP+, L-glutamate forming)